MGDVKPGRDLYDRSGISTKNYSLPLLWDLKSDSAFSNDADEIAQILAPDLAATGTSWVNTNIVNGVFKVGRAESQADYDSAMDDLYSKGLNKLEDMLSDGRSFINGE